MKPKTILGIAVACLPLVLHAQDPSTAQSPSSAQAFLRSSLTQWARVSSNKLEVHYKASAVGAQSENCGTWIDYGGTIVLNWREVGAITTSDLKTGEYPHLLKIERPGGYVQIYFSSAEMMRRTFVAAEFLKNYCASGAF